MDHRQWPIAKDALPMVAGGVITGLILGRWLGLAGWLFPGTFIVFTLFFFRNPQRRIDQSDPKALLSPADGVVMSVETVEEPLFLEGPAQKISIFLNVFNVHINRMPVAGKVNFLKYQPGQFLPAFKSHASQLNERNYVGIQTQDPAQNKVLVVQITGFIARRIVCWVKKEEALEQGARFGLIKFGSCTEVYVPMNARIEVKPGMKLKGGLSVLGRLADE